MLKNLKIQNQKWEQIDTRRNRVELDIDLDVAMMELVREGKISKLIAPGILNTRERIRRKMTKLLVNNVLPRIVRNAPSHAMPGKIPSGHFKTHAKVDHAVGTDFQKEGRNLNMRNRINVKVDLESNQSVSAATAFHHARATIAHSIASGIVHQYKSKIEGDASAEKTHFKTNTNAKGKLSRYRSSRSQPLHSKPQIAQLHPLKPLRIVPLNAPKPLKITPLRPLIPLKIKPLHVAPAAHRSHKARAA